MNRQTKALPVAKVDLPKSDDDVNVVRDDHENPGLPSKPLRWSGIVPLHLKLTLLIFHSHVSCFKESKPQADCRLPSSFKHNILHAIG